MDPMAEPPSWSTIAEFLNPGHLGSKVYRPWKGGIRFDGERPGERWHAHGWFVTQFVVFNNGIFEKLELWKRRWKDTVSGRTCHSRPPDDIGCIRVSAVVLMLVVFVVLNGEHEITRYEEDFPLLEKGEDPPRSPRTVQRWLARAFPRALTLQHAIRLEVIQKSEPRPVEQLFPGGLPPPDRLLKRRWKGKDQALFLWKGLAWLFSGAVALETPVAVLLAGARGRLSPGDTSLI
jgi:hypothetical protein